LGGAAVVAARGFEGWDCAGFGGLGAADAGEEPWDGGAAVGLAPRDGAEPGGWVWGLGVEPREVFGGAVVLLRVAGGGGTIAGKGLAVDNGRSPPSEERTG